MWQLCEETYLEIKSYVIAGRKLKPTKEAKHALESGVGYLLACNMKESFHWIVHMIIVHVCLTFSYESAASLSIYLYTALCVEDINFQLRQRISWHKTKIDSMISTMEETNLPVTFQYVELVLDHSPQSCFTDDEKETAKLLLGKYGRLVKHSDRKKFLTVSLARYFHYFTKTIGLSSSKKLAAVASADGIIYVLSLPKQVE